MPSVYLVNSGKVRVRTGFCRSPLRGAPASR
jgi:hypothetical protein